MERWEYRSMYIGYGKVKTPEGKTVTDWHVNWSDARPTIGLGRILDAEGAAGWELVSLAVEYYERLIMGEHLQAKGYRAVFKRKAESS